MISVCCLKKQVLECSWKELVSKLDGAQDVDVVIAAHDAFLHTVMEGALLLPESQVHLFGLLFVTRVEHAVSAALYVRSCRAVPVCAGWSLDCFSV